MAKAKTTRKPKITKTERNLIEHPPTPETWLCNGDHFSDKGIKITIPNSGKSQICWHCGQNKPKKAEKVWPAYVQACKKADIEPGMSGFEARRALIAQGYTD